MTRKYIYEGPRPVVRPDRRRIRSPFSGYHVPGRIVETGRRSPGEPVEEFFLATTSEVAVALRRLRRRPGVLAVEEPDPALLARIRLAARGRDRPLLSIRFWRAAAG